MHPARQLILSFSMCALLSTARSQDSRTQAWIHQVFDLHQHRYTQQDLFVAGYRANQARDYDTALDKLSRFDKANHDRLHAATSPDEKAFRSWLESRLNDLEEIRKQNTRRDGADATSGSIGGAATSQAPSFAAGANSNSGVASQTFSREDKRHLSGSQGGTSQSPGFSSSKPGSTPGPRIVRGATSTSQRPIYQLNLPRFGGHGRHF
jgi:hypothetical protein